MTVTVDPDLVAAGNEAVAAGRAPSLSAWVNLAIAERAAKERRLQALADAIAAYEAEHGVIDADEIEAQRRADGRTARLVRRPRDEAAAAPSRRRGRLAAADTRDVIDAALVVLAEDGDRIVTSDPDDLEHLAAAAGREVEIVEA